MKKMALYRTRERADLAAAEWKKAGARAVMVSRLEGVHYDFSDVAGLVDVVTGDTWLVEAEG